MLHEQTYTVSLSHSEMRDVQLALLYQIDNVLIPYYEETAKHQDYIPTQELKKQIERLQRVLTYLNEVAGPYSESK